MQELRHELLDAVQTIVRSRNITKGPAASFVVAADGALLRANYEIEYEKFVPSIAEPGRRSREQASQRIRSSAK